MNDENGSVDMPPTKKQKTSDSNGSQSNENRAKKPSPDTNQDADNSDKYTDFVSDKELEKLREFAVLDEVKSNEEDSNDDDSDSSEGICILFYLAWY